MNTQTLVQILLGAGLGMAAGISILLWRRLKAARRFAFQRRPHLAELAAVEGIRSGASWRDLLPLLTPGPYLPTDIRRMAELALVRQRMESVHGLLPEGVAGTAADRKRDTMSKAGPKTFYYLDESQIRDLYPQAFEEPEPKTVETREERASTKGIKAALKIVEPEFGRSTAVQTTKTYEVELTPPIMYNKVEQFLLSRADLTCGVEDFEPDETAIKDFQSTCSLMKAKFKFAIPEDLQHKFITEQKKTIAMKALSRLSETTGYVAVQGDVVVCQSTEEGCTLRFVHPLNNYLGGEPPKCVIDVSCRQSFLKPSGSHLFKEGSSVKVTCVGKIVRWEPGARALIVSPIAVY